MYTSLLVDETDEEDDGTEAYRSGNKSCDCNRKRLFIGPSEDMDFPCGDGAYVIDSIVRKSDGALLYSEPET